MTKKKIILLFSSAILLIFSAATILPFFAFPSAASIGIIGGADGPTKIFIAGSMGFPWSLYLLTAGMFCWTVIYFVRNK